MDYKPRPCDLCGNKDLEEIWRYTHTAKTKANAYLWDVRNVLCRTCGFAFVSPSPTEAALSAYYQDSFENWREQELDYALESRISFLQEHIVPGTRPELLEIGGNVSERFRSALEPMISHYRNIELNTHCEADGRSMNGIPMRKDRILTAYFVLEHVAQPLSFLKECADRLDEGGILILEVPDLDLYPTDPTGLDWFEHTNHFSSRSLTALAAQAGFEIISVSQKKCSRPFGFVAAFTKREGAVPGSPVDPAEVEQARSLMLGGLKKMEGYHHWLSNTRQRILAAGRQPVVIWAANRVCDDLLKGFDLPETAVLVDSNPEKKDFFAPRRVHEPRAVQKELSEAELFVINTEAHAPEILRYIQQTTGCEVPVEKRVIVDPGY